MLPGGGVAALHARHILGETRKRCEGDARIGVDIVFRALTAPLFHIAENSGVSGAIAVARVLQGGDRDYGFDVISGREGNMFEMGIVVPAKVERVALEQAAGVAGLLLTTDALISDLPG